MYAQQRLLRAKNQIDVMIAQPCNKCGSIPDTLEKEWTWLSRADTTVIKEYYKTINFMTVRVYVDEKYISQVNFLDNKTKVLHSEFFRHRKFLTDDNIYLLPFFKVLNEYRKNNVPTALRKLLIESYNEFLIKAVISTSNTKNAVYGKHIANYNPPSILQKLFEDEEIEINNDIKEFISESFLEKYQGKKLSLRLTENSTEIFLKKYKRQDKDNYLAWVIVDDFVNWYIKNYQNYINICGLCYGKSEFKRGLKMIDILRDSFLNKNIVELREMRAKRKGSQHSQAKEKTKQNLQKWRPSVHKAQYGVDITETVIEKGKKVTKTTTKKP
tara:strand:- start:181 stop:1164 length:984 start_codon:yes stop_codon:yes gene_type:complete